jgi:DNA-binding NarL/FixJ family response regulator
VIADDHPLLRDGLIAVLSTQPDFDVIGEAGDGAEALQ